MSPHKSEREQIISEPEVVTVTLHYEQDGRQERGKEVTESAYQVIVGRGVEGRNGGRGYGFLGMNIMAVCKPWY